MQKTTLEITIKMVVEGNVPPKRDFHDSQIMYLLDQRLSDCAEKTRGHLEGRAIKVEVKERVIHEEIVYTRPHDVRQGATTVSGKILNKVLP